MKETILLSLVLAVTASAQSTADDVGVKPFASMQADDLVSVNLSNGNVLFDTSAWPMPKQRGKIPFATRLTMNSKVWVERQWCGDTGFCAYWADYLPGSAGAMMPGFILPSGVGDGPMYFDTNGLPFPSYLVADYDGATHPVYQVQGTSSSYRSLDGSDYLAQINGSGRFAIKEGTKNAADANGNYLSGDAASYIDTVGRAFTATGVSTSDFSGCAGPLTISDARRFDWPSYNGTIASLKVCFVQLALKTNFMNGTDPAYEYVGNVLVTQSIVLPNGQKWIFEYDSRNPGDAPDINYGELTKITTPLGQVISFSYRQVPNITDRYVVSKTVNTQDGTGTHTWNYAYGAFGIEPLNTTRVTDPRQNETVITFAQMCGSNGLYESERRIYEGTASGGDLLKKVTTAYQCHGNGMLYEIGTNIFPTSVQTWVKGGALYRHDTQYLSGGFTYLHPTGFPGGGGTANFAAPSQTSDYNFDGTIANRVRYTYVSNDPGNAAAPDYLAANFLNLPALIETLDGNGNVCGKTQFKYDETGYLVGSGITTQHTSAPFGSIRGNLSSKLEYKTDTPCLPSATWSSRTTHFFTYDTGMLSSQVDAGSHATTYFYSPDYAGAYLTQTNFLDSSHTTKTVYDLNTGLPTSAFDLNNQKTSFDYDYMLRLKTVTYPNLGTLSNTFNDSPGSLYITTQRQLSLSPAKTVQTRAYFDAAGRKVKTQLTDSAQGDIFTETTYDEFGRLATVTNPHRPNVLAGTDGAITYTYDALNRVRTTTMQDMSFTQIDYDGNKVTVTDEAGQQRRTFKDAFGRIIQVDEPGVQ